ncbi:hypothetical protein FE257_011116 [Aspergillus nanangensis]|uniref:Nephrocystin 3-like N-terminal domain-containing protein n=1 Tax=Aspergillus nanangensis TaxID=2582783 RepID=A0AAD4GQV1_ASPNN|nr:hypothetical protein FE257_011116 [Aspergillus nanangensis]
MATLKHLISIAVEELESRRLVCYIDALDECDEDQVRDMVFFFEQLGDFAVSRQVQLLICFSSRHYPHVTIENKTELILEDHGGHERDISNYIHSELKENCAKLLEEGINMGFTLSSPSERHVHPLPAAVVLGNEEAAVVLLKVDASVHRLVNQRCVDDRRLLSVASQKGLETPGHLLSTSCRDETAARWRGKYGGKG